jgi:hypothetical protein
MRQSAVGQKCPNCAKVPRRTRATGKPVHHVRAGAAGLGVAAVGGLVMLQLFAFVGGGILIMSSALGYGVGRAVSWGGQRQTQQPFPAIAVVCAVVGVAGAYLMRFGHPLPASPWLLLAYLAAGFFALRGAQT